MEKIQDKRISLRVSANLLKDISKIKGNSKSDKIKRILEAGLANKPVDNSDYSDLIDAIAELKTEIAPIGGNLNQLALYLNQGRDFSGIGNIEMLSDLQIQFKQWMKITKYLQRDLKRR